MPFYPEETETDFAAVDSTASTAANQDFATAYKTGLDRTPGAATAAMIGGSVVDLADTIGSSLIPGVERNDLNNKFLGAVGSPGLTSWYNENRGAVEVGSGVAGIVLANVLANRVLKPAGFVMRSIRGVPIAGRIAALDSQYERAVRVAQITTRAMASRGAVGAERFVGSSMRLSALGRAPVVLSATSASRNVFGAQAARGLAYNVTTEAIMAAGLHTNSFLYSDDLAHNLAWGAAGLGIGAAIDSMVGAYTLRKMASDDAIRQINARALDVTGMEANRIHSASIVDELIRKADGPINGNNFLFSGSGAITDEITSLAISAGELRKPRGFKESAKALFGKREAAATPTLTIAFEELNKVTTRGLSGVSKAGFGTKIEGLGAPLKESLAKEPGFLYGIEELGTTVDNLGRGDTAALRDSELARRQTAVHDLLGNNGKWKTRRVRTPDGEVMQSELIPLKPEERAALQEEAHLLRFKRSQIPVTMLEPGEWLPLELGKLADNYVPRKVEIEGGLGEGNFKVWSREKLKKGEGTLGISSDGELYIPGNGRLETLSTEDMLGLYHVANKAIRDMQAAGHTLQLPAKPNWFQLDMAEQLIRATDNVDAVEFPGAMTRESALVESFAQKVSAMRIKEQAVKLAGKRGLGETLSDARAFELKVFFNLPRTTSYQQGLAGTGESALDLILAGLRSGDEVRKMGHVELTKLLNDSKLISNFTHETRDTIESLQGNSFNFLMDSNGTPIKPIIGFKRPLAPADWSRDALFTRQAMKHANQMQALIGDSADPITKEMVISLMSDPNSAVARRVAELADDQVRSFLPGFRNASPQSARGRLLGNVVSRERRDVDSEVLRAASHVKDRETRLTNSIMRQLVEGTMGDTITVVNGARNVQSKLLLNQFHTFRPGWELARDTVKVPLPDGKTGFQFVLDHESSTNKAWFKERFGKELTKGQVLLNPNGTEIVLDELGMDVLNRMQQIHDIQLAMKNTLLRSQGLPELKSVPWYAPPSNDKGKFVAYVFDMQDNVIPGMKVSSDTSEGLAREIAALEPKLKPGQTIRTRNRVESFMSLWDKAQMDFIAPNVTAIQPLKKNFGKSGGSLLNTNAFDEALVMTRDNLVRHGSDLLHVLFDEPIKAAKVRASLARVEKGVGDKAIAGQGNSVHDMWIQNLTGRTTNETLDRAENFLNELLADSKQTLSTSKTYQGLKEFLRTAKPGQSVSGAKFDKLAQSLGEYMPFKSAMEMVERELGSQTPKEIAALSNKLSWFESASRLRWFESMHAVANIGSILANTPSVIRAIQPMVGETLEEAAKRNGTLALMTAMPDGQGVGLLNMPRLMWSTMKEAWKKTPDEFTKQAIRLGYMDQEVAEFQRAWGSIDSKEGWRGFVFGNEAAEGTGVGGKIARSGGLDKWLSILSDKSEAMSRQWGMYIGRDVAAKMGITKVDDQLAFAHEITNKMIANYDPRNRPAIFQGALGAPIGLFQSYVMNYYQRMFRYLETGNARALATQYASQSAVFGVASVPGWGALNWAFFDNQKSENEDPVDSMDRRFGTFDSDLIMHGVLSNLPKIFGGDGVSLYTRGDSQYRMPVNPVTAVTDLVGITSGSNAAQIPVADTMKRLFKGVVEGVSQLGVNGGISPTHAAEILSNMLTNRPLAGMLEVAALDGNDTSWDGQVISQARTAGESLFRVLGVRAMHHQKEIENFYQNRNAEEEQNARKTTLRSATRAAIRAGSFEEIPGLFAKYVDAGGDPRYYTRWLKSSFEAAIDSRGERMLDRALRDQSNPDNALIARLLDAQVDINESDLTTDDYGREAEMDKLIEQGWETTPTPEDSGLPPIGQGEPPEDPLEM